jgi:HAD superfamily 5'-nucleotidase-like hydrolase
MSVADPAAQLGQLLQLSREADIPRKKRVFVNRNLKMGEVELIGFDMDYTLAIYRQAQMERLSVELTLKKLVENKGYPHAIASLEYPPDWAVRGLMVDKQHGNIFKMDQYGHVGRVYHGGRQLTREERAKLYRQTRVKTSAPRYAWIDTLFALPETVIYLRMVEHAEKGGADHPAPGYPRAGNTLDYERIWDDVRYCIDEAHRDDTLKSVVKADIGRFVVMDPDLGPTLHKLRSAGKRLFVLTNSLWDYTDQVMRYLLDGQMAAYPSWRNYFDVVIVGGAKPGFFTEQRPFVEIDPANGQSIGAAKGPLQRGHVYSGGCLPEFEERAGARGERVLYVGDHIYGDILRAKKSSVWRTAMIVQELETELEVSDRLADSLKELDELDRRRRNLDAEVDFQNLILKSLQRMEDAGAVLPNFPFGSLEVAKHAAKDALDRLRAALRQTTVGLDALEVKVESAYNRHWGPIFREGNERSRFGEQVESYACLYTSRVSNFLAYSPLRYFRSPRDKLPHEL